MPDGGTNSYEAISGRRQAKHNADRQDNQHGFGDRHINLSQANRSWGFKVAVPQVA